MEIDNNQMILSTNFKKYIELFTNNSNELTSNGNQDDKNNNNLNVLEQFLDNPKTINNQISLELFL